MTEQKIAPVLSDDEIDPRLLGWLRARQDWNHVLLDRAAVRQLIAVLARVGAVREQALEEAALILDEVGARIQQEHDEDDNSYWMGVGKMVDSGEIAIRALKGTPAAATESVLIEGVAHTVPAAVAAELLWLHLQLLGPAADEECDKPPFGWRCTRTHGHAGPCAAVEAPDDVAVVERCMDRLRKAAHVDHSTPAAAVADHVGESDFEVWFESYQPKGKGAKQQACDAYAAGMDAPQPSFNPGPLAAVERDLMAALIDIYDDQQNNPPESRCYVDTAWTETLAEARAALLAHLRTKGDA